jgi:pyruvate/2-oxoglutarate dehydrogenase complex dihydrolipoamide dehydrogenase (E3) component
MARVVVIGGGPAGYEAALVARQLGADVTLIHSAGLGGSAVLTDVVPSKGLISVSQLLTRLHESVSLGINIGGDITVDMKVLNDRLKTLASTQSHDIEQRLVSEGVTLIAGTATMVSPTKISVSGHGEIEADIVLLATGARPRLLDDAMADGERILTWEQLYDLPELPSKLIVIGSGVTGAEFASAYHALGSEVVLVSSRDQVLPGEDADAARVIEEVFARRGIQVMQKARAASVTRTATGVEVTLQDGRTIVGSHCLLAVGSLPNTESLGLENAGVTTDERGFISVDRVSRTSARNIYAAGDCTGVLMLASTAAMQGRIAMWHALGDAVTPLDLTTVSANVFTDPEIATVGVTQKQLDSGDADATVVTLPLNTNARAKMQGFTDGFIKMFCIPANRTVIGGVVVAPNASELIYPIAVAVSQRLTVDDLASTFTIYPSLSGSIAEAARRLH